MISNSCLRKMTPGTIRTWTDAQLSARTHNRQHLPAKLLVMED